MKDGQRNSSESVCKMITTSTGQERTSDQNECLRRLLFRKTETVGFNIISDSSQLHLRLVNQTRETVEQI